MSEIGRLPCPNPECDSSDAYFWNTEKEQGHCKSCDAGTWLFKGKVWLKKDGQKKGTPLDNHRKTIGKL